MADESKVAEIDAPAEEKIDKKDKLDQSVEIKDTGPCRKHIKVTIKKSSIDRLLADKYKEIMGESYVPGFRPGKAPRKIVVQRYKKEVFDQVKSALLLASLEQLADDFDVAPLAPPNLNPNMLEFKDDSDFTYEFEVEVRPEFDLPNYKNLKLKRPVRTFSDKDVQDEQHRILSRFGQLIPKENGTAEKGDYVVLDMTTNFNGQVVGTVKETTIRVDDTVTFKDAVVPNFGKQLAGVKAGETRTVDVNMTDAAATDLLRGKTVQGTLEVKDVKTMRLPELTEEFLETLGVKTEDQLRERLRIVLEARLQYEQRQSARDQVLEQISSASQWQLPQDLLQRQARRSFGRRLMEMREAGISEDEIQSRQRILQRDVLSSTEKSLKEHFVLQKIAETEKLEINEDDINSEIERIADQYNETPRRIRSQMEKEDLLETLAAQLLERKALDLILESAEYEDVQVAHEESMSASDQQAAHGELQDPTAAPPAAEKIEETKEAVKE